MIRPKATIVAITHDEFTFNKLSLCWGVKPVLTKELETLEEMLETAEYIVKEQRIAKAQDKIGGLLDQILRNQRRLPERNDS